MESSYIINISLYSYDTSKCILIPQTNQVDIINAYTIMHQLGMLPQYKVIHDAACDAACHSYVTGKFEHKLTMLCL